MWPTKPLSRSGAETNANPEDRNVPMENRAALGNRIGEKGFFYSLNA